jgi:putative transposase
MTSNKRLKISGPALVFITTTVTNWIPVFQNENNAMAIIEQLKETSEFHKASIMGYVVMPSHVHALVGLREYADLSKLMKAFKGITSRKLKSGVLREYGEKLMADGKFHLWKRRFDDVVIYSEEQLKIKLDYIHNNPVKDGLVENPIDWAYSSARDWLIEITGFIKIDKNYSWLK